MKAIWNGVVLAESDDTVVIEGNHYFPRGALNAQYFEDSDHTSTCFWKGEAQYYHVVAGGERNENAAWYYPSPSKAARGIEDRIAFWKGVKVTK